MDKDELWSSVLAAMLDGTQPSDPKNFFLPQLHALGVFGDQFILLADNEQVENWVRMNYLAEISAAAASVSGMAYTVQIASNPAGSATQTAPQATTSAQAAPAQPIQAQPAQAAAQSFAAQAPQQAAMQAQPMQTTPEEAGAASPATGTPHFAVPSFIEQEPVQAAPPQPETAGSKPDFMNTFVSMSDIAPRPAEEVSPAQTQASVQERAKEATLQSRQGNEALFSKCTFETFVVGSSNNFARGAALAVAEQPGTVYNPLFIYGKSGLGKTHLLVSIANYVQSNYPLMATRYVSANDFLNDYVEATQKNRWNDFNAKYHHADVLLVDDVQYLEGKGETINQLFNIFNEMINMSKQVVLSADRAPKDIDMDTRMRSRFASGMTVDVQPPDYEMRLAIIKSCYQRVQQTTTFTGLISEEVLSWLAENASTNIREIEGAVTRLIGNMSLTGKPEITIDEAQEVLQDFFPDVSHAKITIAAIQAEVERYFKVSHEDMVSSKRNKNISSSRHIAIYLCRYMTSESLAAIGAKFGGRDHTTVMHSVGKIEKDQQANRILYDQLQELRERIMERSQG